MLSGYNRAQYWGILLLGLGAVFSASADKIHDPTMPKVLVDMKAVSSATGTVVKQELELQGIVSKRNTRMAIISGQLHQVGDIVDGYLISQVHKDHVVLSKSGSQKRLYVYE